VHEYRLPVHDPQGGPAAPPLVPLPSRMRLLRSIHTEGVNGIKRKK